MEPDKLSYNVNEAAAAVGISPRKVYELAKAGEITLFKLGGRTLIRRDALEAYVDRVSRGPAGGAGFQRRPRGG